MADLTTHELVAAGTAPTFTEAADPDTAEVGSGKNTFAVYKNSTGGDIDVTVTAPGSTSYGEDNPDPVVTVPDSGEAWIPMRKAFDNGDARASLSPGSTAAGLTVAVVRIL